MESFHFQDLIDAGTGQIKYFLPLDNFERHGAPATTEEYVEYRAMVLECKLAGSEEAFGIVRAQQVVVEHDSVHRDAPLCGAGKWRRSLEGAVETTGRS